MFKNLFKKLIELEERRLETPIIANKERVTWGATLFEIAKPIAIALLIGLDYCKYFFWGGKQVIGRCFGILDLLLITAAVSGMALGLVSLLATKELLRKQTEFDNLPPKLTSTPLDD